MSILFYKQRHRNPNFKDTAGANYAHIRYIATRPRVMKNEASSHGLFGKLEPGTLTEFEDWKEVAKKVYANSKKGIVMYRSVVSFTEETAKELLLKDQKSWQRYVENHIMTIAEKMASNGNICNGQHPSMGKRATHMCISCSGITQSVQRILLPVQRYRMRSENR